MHSAKNLKAIFERLRTAGTPPKFTHEFLKQLGFGSSSNRPVIQILRALGFLNTDGVPTARYNEYRDANRSGYVLAHAIREAWAPVFLTDERAYERTSSYLVEAFKSITGKGEAVAQKMATTFRLLCELADWSTPPSVTQVVDEAVNQNGDITLSGTDGSFQTESFKPQAARSIGLHHDIHVHLPATSDVTVYTAIFRALKAELYD